MTPAQKPAVELPVKLFKDQKAWEQWLSKHTDANAGLYLRIAKKSSTLRSVTYQEALDVALCYGWIDGIKKTYDENSWLQKFTPRRPKSMWSKINRTKAVELIANGSMKPSGFAAIEQAKANGNWDGAYDSYSTAEPSPDFLAALDEHPEAKAFFATVNRLNRFAVLVRIQTAKTEVTRKKRIDLYIRMLEKHELLVP
jgi:uncharacterized protein YdeI (YjbR/CyaY-like superfamily)